VSVRGHWYTSRVFGLHYKWVDMRGEMRGDMDVYSVHLSVHPLGGWWLGGGGGEGVLCTCIQSDKCTDSNHYECLYLLFYLMR
jgi:hypothetical protein